MVSLLQNGAISLADTTTNASHSVNLQLPRHHQPLDVARRQVVLRYLQEKENVDVIKRV